jgi:hypothetical protein
LNDQGVAKALGIPSPGTGFQPSIKIPVPPTRSFGSPAWSYLVALFLAGTVAGFILGKLTSFELPPRAKTPAEHIVPEITLSTSPSIEAGNESKPATGGVRN